MTTDGVLKRALNEAGLDPDLVRIFVAYADGKPQPAVQFNEEEVSRRLQVLKTAAAGDPDYEEMVTEVQEFHNQRRAAAWTGDSDETL